MGEAGLKRYKCKGCNRTFNALTGTPLATLKHRDRWLAYAKALVDGVSLRKAAKRARIDLTTAFRWRHRFLKVPKTMKAAAVTGIVEADETSSWNRPRVRRSSSGAARESAAARRRRRDLDGRAHSGADLRDDRRRRMRVPDLEAATIARLLQPVVAKDALLVTMVAPPTASSADANGLLHIKLVTSNANTPRQLSHPERQRLHQPPQALDAPLQRRRHPLPG